MNELYPVYKMSSQVYDHFLARADPDGQRRARCDDYLEGVDGWKKVVLTIILDNQRMMLDHMRCNEISNKYPSPAFIADNALEILSRAWKECRVFDWVGIWPMIGPVTIVYTYSKNGEYTGQDLAAKTRMMKHCCSAAVDENENITLCRKNLLVQDLVTDIEQEVLGDLGRNCGTVKTLEFSEGDYKNDDVVLAIDAAFREVMESISNDLQEWYGDVKQRRFNWIVMHPDVYHMFRIFSDKDYRSDNDEPRWYNEAVRVFVDPLRDKNEILVGWKGDEFQTGYQYCPYVGLTTTPGIVLDGVVEGYGLLKRYAKKLHTSKAYGKIILKGL